MSIENLIKDIRKTINDDRIFFSVYLDELSVEIKVSRNSIGSCKEDEIPIVMTLFDGEIMIDFHSWHKAPLYYSEVDLNEVTGLWLEDIDIIHNIMIYLRDNCDAISKLSLDLAGKEEDE